MFFIKLSRWRNFYLLNKDKSFYFYIINIYIPHSTEIFQKAFKKLSMKYETFQKNISDMFQICFRYMKCPLRWDIINVSEIFLKCFWNISEMLQKYLWNASEISLKCFGNISEMFQKYTGNISDTFSHIQGDPEQCPVLHKSYSWTHCKTIFPFAKCYPILSCWAIKLVCLLRAYLLTRPPARNRQTI